MINKIIKTEEEWKEDLTAEQYRVLRERGTEAPMIGKYVYEKSRGEYKCAACGQELFSSESKFDSNCGWPSFDQSLPGAVELIPDDSHDMHRTEVVCQRCDSHLGHVFDDGPTDTGKRYCMNSISLDLEKDNK